MLAAHRVFESRFPPHSEGALWDQNRVRVGDTLREKNYLIIAVSHEYYFFKFLTLLSFWKFSPEDGFSGVTSRGTSSATTHEYPEAFQ